MDTVHRQFDMASNHRRPSRRRGMVLFVIVILVAMISLAGLGYVAVMSTEHKAVRLRGDELQIEMAVGSGVEMMRVHLQQKSKPAKGRRFLPTSAVDRQFRGVVVMDDDTGRRTRFSVISPKVENDRVAGIRFGVANESARLNLAVLPEWDQRRPGAAREALMSLPDMTQSIADAILDWVDRDTVPRPHGAEASYYAGLGVPYGPRNAEPTSLEELLLVRDVTREMLFGADANFNYTIDPGEQAGTGRAVHSAPGGASAVPWAMMLTVFSAEKNLNPDGQPKIDLNDRNLSSLHGRLEQVIDADLAKFIILCRQYRRVAVPSSKSASLSPKKLELDFDIRPRYNFTSVLDLLDTAVEVRLNDEKKTRQTVRGPLKSNGRTTRETLPLLLDYVSIGSRPTIRGRVNLLEAPEEVLTAVPGISEALARRITARRQAMSTTKDSARRHPTWLLGDGLVDIEQMKALMPYVTGGGDVYRAQVVGFFDDRGPVSRAEVVIDATSVPPRQVYYKDLRLLGRGYSIDTLRGTAAGVPEPLEAPKPLEMPELP